MSPIITDLVLQITVSHLNKQEGASENIWENVNQ